MGARCSRRSRRSWGAGAFNSGFIGGILTAPILDCHMEVLLVEALRFRSVSAARERRVARGSLGFRAGPQLREIHVDAARRRTIDQLARAGGMSRAVFAERFARKGRMPPCITCFSGA